MAIDRDTWAIVGPLFERLLYLSPSERVSELDVAKLDLRHRSALDALLEAHDAEDDLLAASAIELLGLDADSNAAPDWTGRMLGPWRVERRLAEGGMSVVYAGARADGRFDLQVAIKVLKTDRVHIAPERLEAETRILARLQHPGIARLIDSGAGDDGLPYLVLEFVSGTPIDRHCVDHHLDMCDRIRLVLAVADALDYAHQRQVVHCDIKPANVLVRPDGRPCILDFGISALVQLDDPGSQSVAGFCSPGFAAPECYQHAPPDTAQDVFALGAVLSELLVEGGVKTLSITTDARQTLSPDASPRPLPASDGSSRLPSDLTAILHCALAHQPEHRYRSISALAADLQAWLENRPVAAWYGGRSYALGKWLRRHRAVASLGLLAALSLLGGASMALHQAGLARAEAERAVAVRDFTVGLFEAADPTREAGEDPPASELLQRGANRVVDELENQPALQAEMLQVIGAIQLERGLVEPAAATLDRMLALNDQNEIDPTVLAMALSDRGLVAFEQGDLDASIDLLVKARLRAKRAALPATERALIAIRQAEIHVIRAEPEQALALIEPVLDLEDASIQAAALRAKGGALEQAGRLDEAAATLERALAVQTRLNPDDVYYALILDELGIVRWQQQRQDDAAAIFQRSLDHKRRILGDVHPQTLTTISNLAVVQAARGDLIAAERALTDSLTSLTVVYGDEPHPAKAYTHGMLAWTLYRRNMFEDAWAHARRAQALYQALAGDYPMVDWIPAITGLVGLEFSDPDAGSLLYQWHDDCAVLDGKRERDALFCLARAWLAATAGECESDLVPTASDDTLIAIPERWRAVHAAVVEICAGRPIPQLAAMPHWVQTEAAHQ